MSRHHCLSFTDSTFIPSLDVVLAAIRLTLGQAVAGDLLPAVGDDNQFDDSTGAVGGFGRFYEQACVTEA
ncbi:hypothetical protein HispidOSU_018253, partial [Sigmodon hispidus]